MAAHMVHVKPLNTCLLSLSDCSLSMLPITAHELQQGQPLAAAAGTNLAALAAQHADANILHVTGS